MRAVYCAGGFRAEYAVVKSVYQKHAWRKFLTADEVKEMAAFDDMLTKISALQAIWKKTHAPKRKLIQNRACQRARYAVSHLKK